MLKCKIKSLLSASEFQITLTWQAIVSFPHGRACKRINFHVRSFQNNCNIVPDVHMCAISHKEQKRRHTKTLYLLICEGIYKQHCTLGRMCVKLCDTYTSHMTSSGMLHIGM